jgi:hypothetical protein
VLKFFIKNNLIHYVFGVLLAMTAKGAFFLVLTVFSYENACLLGVLFYPEEGSDIFPRNFVPVS